MFEGDFVSYKGRSVKEGQLVRVYRNLNRKGVVYSIVNFHTGLVVGHASKMVLNHCSFDVSQAGRERVLREQKKNVHAYITGNYETYGEDADDVSVGSFVEYNPYKMKTFQHRWSGEPIYSSPTVIIRWSHILAVV